MPGPGENPKSYDDIVRSTVVDPDSSQRPSAAQERAARNGFRTLDSDEQALHDRVAQALAASGAALADVSIEIARDLVTLRGRVANAAQLRRLEDVVAALPGVSTIHNQVVIATPSQ